MMSMVVLQICFACEVVHNHSWNKIPKTTITIALGLQIDLEFLAVLHGIQYHVIVEFQEGLISYEC